MPPSTVSRRLPEMEGPEPTVNVPETLTRAALLMLSRLSEPATPITRLVVFHTELLPVTMTVLALAVALLPTTPLTLPRRLPVVIVSWLLEPIEPMVRSPAARTAELLTVRMPRPSSVRRFSTRNGVLVPAALNESVLLEPTDADSKRLLMVMVDG